MKKPNNPPAFPRTGYINDYTERCETTPNEGMTLRDYFAAKAMQSILATSNMGDSLLTVSFCSVVAEEAYTMADAMLLEREKE